MPELTRPTTMTVVAEELLNNGGDAGTQQDTADGVGGNALEHRLKAAASLLLQRLSHNVHAEQEQCQTADKSQKIKKGHTLTSLLQILVRYDFTPPMSNPHAVCVKSL